MRSPDYQVLVRSWPRQDFCSHWPEMVLAFTFTYIDDRDHTVSETKQKCGEEGKVNNTKNSKI